MIVEDCKNDERLEGCGEKILHLLQKFNVENVLLIMGIDRKDSYSILNPEYYHIIIERAKDLLSTLYEKVIENEVHKKIGKTEDTDISDIRYDEKNRKFELQPKQQMIDFQNVPQFHPTKKKKTERPNYYLNQAQRENKKIVLPVDEPEKDRVTENFLRHNLERNSEKIESILESWTDNDYQYLKFMCLYDRNTKVEKVFKILMILENIMTLQDLSQNYDFKQRLPMLRKSFVGKEKCKKIIDMLRIDKYLNSKILMVENHVIAALLDYLTLIVRNYEIAQKILEFGYKKEHKQNSPSPNKMRGSAGAEDLVINVKMTKQMSSVIDDNIKMKVDDGDLETQIKKQLKERRRKDTLTRDDSHGKLGSQDSEGDSKGDSPRESRSDLLNPNNPIYNTNNSNHPNHPNRGNNHRMNNANPNRSSSQGSVGPEDEFTNQSQKIKYGEDIPYDPEEIKKYLEDNPIENQPSENLEIIADRLKDYRIKNE